MFYENWITSFDKFKFVLIKATGKAFDKLVRAKTCTANDILILLQQKTHIQNDYLTEVFMQITNSSNKEGKYKIWCKP